MAKRAPSLSCRLSRSRRTLAALLLLGGAAMTSVAGPAAAHDHAVPKIPIPEVLADCLPQPTADAADALGDWRFDDWLAEACGMVPGAEAIGKLAKTASKAESLQPAAVPLGSDRSFARDLSDLTCEEPVDIHSGSGLAHLPENGSELAKDVAVVPSEPVASIPPSEALRIAQPAQASMPNDPPATAPPRLASLALVGSSPIIATLPDTYLAYDLSPEDAIAMRMYPIDQPSPNYSAARRTSVYGAVAALEVSPWRIVSEPAVTVSTAGLAANASKSTAQLAGTAAPTAPPEPTEADKWLAVLASNVVQAVQPDSEVRSRLRPQQLGTALGQWSQRSSTLADRLMANLTSPSVQIAASTFSGEAAMLVAQAELQAPRQASAKAAAPLLPTSQGRVLQVELACQAAIEVVMAQAARSPQAEPTQSLAPAPVDSVAHAAAVATVCDQAAASLEKLAMAIRRAGDSWVRQAQVNAGNGSLLR